MYARYQETRHKLEDSGSNLLGGKPEIGWIDRANNALSSGACTLRFYTDTVLTIALHPPLHHGSPCSPRRCQLSRGKG